MTAVVTAIFLMALGGAIVGLLQNLGLLPGFLLGALVWSIFWGREQKRRAEIYRRRCVALDAAKHAAEVWRAPTPVSRPAHWARGPESQTRH